MEKKARGYGLRGWLLIIWIATAFLAYMVVGNYPLNILSDLYGGQQTLSMVYTVASIIGIIVQICITPAIGRMKSVKTFGVIMGVLSIVALLGIMFIPGNMDGTPNPAWIAVYAIGTVLTVMYGTFALSILVGQWFPTKKGGVMGIATMAFPLGNGLVGVFAGLVFKNGFPNVVGGFLPFLIVMIIGLVIGIIAVPDFPEQKGGYRDNNPNMTPEMAKKMLEEEIDARRTSVWKFGHAMTTRDFWFLTIPAGFLLGASVGTMTQSNAIIASAGLGDQFSMIMALVMIFGLAGSFVLGFLDDKFGTKKAMIIACVIMLIAGILGIASKANGTLVIPALICLALFMGASSNFTVSLAAQYWRREDFPTVFSSVNPIANLINAFGPMLVGMAMGMTGGQYVPIFVGIAVLGAIAIILCFCFSAKHVKEKDDKYRTAAGKALDDALIGRK